MRRDVTRGLEDSSLESCTSNIPIECHVALKSLLHQEIVEKMEKVIIVGFVIERERVAVLKECAKLQRELTEQLKSG